MVVGATLEPGQRALGRVELRLELDPVQILLLLAGELNVKDKVLKRDGATAISTQV